MTIVVSACLLGKNCKYNGGNNYSQQVIDFLQGKDVIAICPELLAGMPAPRPPVELVQGRAVNNQGVDVDAAYRRGVQAAMEQIKGQDIALAILKSRSPTCGVRQIYDGTFSKKLIDGSGLFAEALLQEGYTVIEEEGLENFLYDVAAKENPGCLYTREEKKTAWDSDTACPM